MCADKNIVEGKAEVKLINDEWQKKDIMTQALGAAWFSDQEDDDLFEPATDALILANRIMWLGSDNPTHGEFDLNDAFAVLFKILTPEDLLFISRHEEYIFGADELCEPLMRYEELTRDFTDYP